MRLWGSQRREIDLFGAVSAATKIADYPFTTLHPNLGVVAIDGKEFVMTGIPGDSGAHKGAGLGHQFLGHVERCQILLHLIDATGEDPIAAWHTLRNELKAYGGDLYEKPELVALTKLDATPEDYAADLIAALKKAGVGTVMTLSSVSGAGVTDALRQLVAVIDESRTKRSCRRRLPMVAIASANPKSLSTRLTLSGQSRLSVAR